MTTTAMTEATTALEATAESANAIEQRVGRNFGAAGGAVALCTAYLGIHLG